MVEESNIEQVVNVNEWIKKNEENFKPPVCNAVMAGGFLKIMFVGGPNVRKDYHLDQAEEFFYMIKGDMCLKVMVNGEPKDIHIKEGEVFLLPSCIPHSPQRNANTLGLVIERDRSDRYDGLRYYCADNRTILWQKFFHLHQLTKDFLPVIKEFMASEQYETGKPVPGTTATDAKIFIEDTNTVPLDSHPLMDFIKRPEDIVTLFDSNEFSVKVYKHGQYELCNKNETWIWVKYGSAECCVERNYFLKQDDSMIILPKKTIDLKIMENSICLLITNNATPPPMA